MSVERTSRFYFFECPVIGALYINVASTSAVGKIQCMHDSHTIIHKALSKYLAGLIIPLLVMLHVLPSFSHEIVY